MRPGMLLMFQHPRRSQYAPVFENISFIIAQFERNKSRLSFRFVASVSTILKPMTQTF